MIKLILRTAIILCLIILSDFVVGHAIGYLTDKIETGGQGRDNYICNKCEDDILVFGSSRALHHYDMKVITNTLGMDGFNCGADGCGILLAYARLKMVCERHQPKIIIYDLVSGYDLLPGDNAQQLLWLKNRYGREGVAEIFNDVDPMEKYKMLSCCYRFNSTFIKSLFVGLSGYSVEKNLMGFAPLEGKITPTGKKVEKGKTSFEYDPVKMKYMDRFIELAKGSHLYFVQSPIWYEADEAKIQEAKVLRDRCEREGIPFIDYVNDPKFKFADPYFADGKHMNAHGAAIFSQDLASRIKEMEAGTEPVR